MIIGEFASSTDDSPVVGIEIARKYARARTRDKGEYLLVHKAEIVVHITEGSTVDHLGCLVRMTEFGLVAVQMLLYREL